MWAGRGQYSWDSAHLAISTAGTVPSTAYNLSPLHKPFPNPSAKMTPSQLFPEGVGARAGKVHISHCTDGEIEAQRGKTCLRASHQLIQSWNENSDVPSSYNPGQRWAGSLCDLGRFYRGGRGCLRVIPCYKVCGYKMKTGCHTHRRSGCQAENRGYCHSCP